MKMQVQNARRYMALVLHEDAYRPPLMWVTSRRRFAHMLASRKTAPGAMQRACVTADSVALVAVAVSASTARQGMFSCSMRPSRKYADLQPT